MKTLPRHRRADHDDRAVQLARHLSDDHTISFDDIRAMPEPEWSRRPAQTWGRWTPSALVPVGLLAAVPLPPVEPDPPVESEASAFRAAELMADHVTVIRALVDAAPFARHEDAVQMALAPIVEMLAAPQPRPLNTAYALRESAHDTRQLCITNYGPFDLYNIDGWRELFDVEQWIQTEALKHAEAAAPATTLAEVA